MVAWNEAGQIRLALRINPKGIVMKKTYYALVDGFINGALRDKGSSCGEMTERDAKYWIMSGHITDSAPNASAGKEPALKEPDPTLLDKKTR